MFGLAPSSNQRAVRLLARDILRRAVGDRLPTSMQYQELLNVGSGTVQKGLRVLESAGATELRARGHQGTFLAARHVGRLWAIAGLDPVTGAMPLPDSPEGSGLAAGLREQFDELGIPLQMRYMHGSANRLGVVRELRADFAVLSAGAAENARAADADRGWTEVDFGSHSYYSEGSIVVLLHPRLSEPGRRAVRRVGIDRDSYDNARFTLAEFPDSEGYEYETHDYPHLPAAVAEGRIDAAVWHRTALPIPLELVDIEVRSLERTDAIGVCESLSRAILLATQEKPEVEAILRNLDVPRIRDVQARVISHELAPAF